MGLEDGAAAEISNTSVYDNTATVEGGGLGVLSGASLVLSEVSISGNTAGHGGGLLVRDSQVEGSGVTWARSTTSERPSSAPPPTASRAYCSPRSPRSPR